jgi:hypothetical protein
MGQLWRRLGRPFERACRLSHKSRALQVPQRYKVNRKLGTWVATQRINYKFYKQGKTSSTTPSRIQALESLGFEWKLPCGWRKGTPKTRSLDDDVQQHGLKKTPVVEKSTAIKSTSLSKPNNPFGLAKSTSTLSRVEPQDIRRVEAGDERFDKTELGGSPSELAAKPSACSDRQVSKSPLWTSQYQRVIVRGQTLEMKLPRRNSRGQHAIRQASTQFPMPSWLQGLRKMTF